MKIRSLLVSESLGQCQVFKNNNKKKINSTRLNVINLIALFYIQN